MMTVQDRAREFSLSIKSCGIRRRDLREAKIKPPTRLAGMRVGAQF
jgi:hypothetical protein